MKAKFDSNMEYGRKTAKYLIAAASLLAVVGIFLVQDGSPTQIILIIAAFCVLIGSVFTIYRHCRCPYCGKHIFFGVLRVKVCPSCNRDLSTGKLVKKHER